MADRPATNWLSYGAGVNSTALLVALLDGRVQADPWRIVWADTKDEKDATYDYVFHVVQPLLRRHGRTLEIVCDREGVIERWERLQVTGSRIIRACTRHAKIDPIKRHIRAHGGKDDVQLIGIDAGESHRAKPGYEGELRRRFPLIELDWAREECVEAIVAAGLPLPEKSGCWHCPFMRVREIEALAQQQPEKFRRIVALEKAANAAHPSTDGVTRTHWGDRPALEWAARACAKNTSGPLFQAVDPDPPCVCFDGDDTDGE